MEWVWALPVAGGRCPESGQSVTLLTKARTGGVEASSAAPVHGTRCNPAFLHAPPPCAAGALHLETHPQPCVVSSVQVTQDSRTYSVGVCTAAAGLDEGGCKDGGVCLLSGSKGASFGRLASMRLDYRHQDEAVILSYANGDVCPPGESLLGGMFTCLVNVKSGLAAGES